MATIGPTRRRRRWTVRPDRIPALVSSFMGQPCSREQPSWPSELRTLALYIVEHQNMLTTVAKHGALDVVLNLTLGSVSSRAVVVTVWDAHRLADRRRTEFDSGWIPSHQASRWLEAMERMVACLAGCVLSDRDLEHRLQAERTRIVLGHKL